MSLRQASEEAKVGLSRQDAVSVTIDTGGGSDPLCSVRLDRDQLNSATRHLVARLWGPLEALARETRTQLGGQNPETLVDWQPPDGYSKNSVDSDRPAPLGVEFSVFAAKIGQGSNASPAKKFSAPPRKPTGVILVGAATRMPSVLAFIRHVTGLEPAAGVDPEEAVALGAAIHAGILQVGAREAGMV